MAKRVASAEEMQEEAARFAAHIAPHTSAATVIALSGDLGAGKTTFTQGLARSLGIGEIVASPTFVIQKEYALPDAPWDKLVHIDAYRLNDADELSTIRWDELVDDPRNLIVIEWPERVAGAIPDHARPIRFDIDGDARTLSYGEEKN